MIFYLFKQLELDPTDAVYGTIIAYILNFVIISAISINSTIMNFKRYKLSLQIESTNKRMLAGEKLKGSEIIMPAISHEISGPLSNSRLVAEVLSNEISALKLNNIHGVKESLNILFDSLDRANNVINRYKNISRKNDVTNPAISIIKLIDMVKDSLNLSQNLDFIININSLDDMNIISGSAFIPILRDIFENSIVHCGGNSTTVISISWNYINDSNLWEIIITDNGSTVDKNISKYLEQPVLKSQNGVSKTTLGLYFSRLRLEHEFGAKIYCDESNKQGTKIVILIPASFIEIPK